MTTGIECAFLAFLPAAPELRTSAAGKPLLTFSAGVGEGEAVQWARVAVFGERAIELSRMLAKGNKVYVEGRLTLQEWTGKGGEARHGLNVAAWRVEPLRQIGRNRSQQAKPEAADKAAPAGVDRSFDDPLPHWEASP